MAEVLGWLWSKFLFLLPVALWCAWWLWGVNWKKAWPVLAGGAWAPVVLLMVMAALVWSRIAPASCDCLGFPVANFWWQLGAVGALVTLALFCGWVQGRLDWTPQEINLEPPPASHSPLTTHHSPQH
jgi:hypothetical protein